MAARTQSPSEGGSPPARGERAALLLLVDAEEGRPDVYEEHGQFCEERKGPPYGGACVLPACLALIGALAVACSVLAPALSPTSSRPARPSFRADAVTQLDALTPAAAAAAAAAAAGGRGSGSEVAPQLDVPADIAEDAADRLARPQHVLPVPGSELMGQAVSMSNRTAGSPSAQKGRDILGPGTPFVGVDLGPVDLGFSAPFIGVNLGGWLLLENWMWEEEMREAHIPDEHTLIQLHGGPRDERAKALIRTHWDTFLTEQDLDRLQAFGVTHVRVPIGWWLVDYDPADGFVNGSELYLRRLLRWLRARGMRAVLDLHALPGAQAVNQSFTGRVSPVAGFFRDRGQFKRGKRAMRRLAELILYYESQPETAGVVLGMELVNEPDWHFWSTSPGIRELYETMVPELRRQLPATRYALFLSFMESPHVEGANWLASMRAKDPESFAWVVYDAHVYHSFGDDNQRGREWNQYVDSCKTCCRDPQILAPIVHAELPVVVGEYALNTGFAGSPDFYRAYMAEQLSLWAHVPGMVGSFFWNFKILRRPDGWFKEMSLLDLLAPQGPVPPVSEMDLSVLCPGEDLRRCPAYDPRTVRWTDGCVWRGAADAGGGEQPRNASIDALWLRAPADAVAVLVPK